VRNQMGREMERDMIVCGNVKLFSILF